MWVSLLPLFALVLLLVYPGSLEGKLATLLRGVCAQRPDHALGFAGATVVLEARMLGIFLGFAIGVLSSWTRGRWRRSELPKGMIGLVVSLGIVVMAADGVNAALFDLGQPHLYAPRNDLRLGTGLWCGLGMAAFIAPVVSFVLWRQREPLPLFQNWRELGWGVFWMAFAGLLIGLGIVPGPLLAAVGALSVVGSFWLVSTYLAVLAWDGPGGMESWTDLAGQAGVGFLLALLELFAMSALRTWMETSLGLTWLV